MKILMKRALALLLTLMLIVGFVPAEIFSVSAATVDYIYSGNYIYNWGARGEVATFLSPNAVTFYEDISYYALAELDGSATESSVPESALYVKLQEIMTEAHKTITSYDGTRDLYQYTDCENSGSPTTISAFYSGQAVGPAWDSGSTWNREHTWPNSKGDLAGSGENDIMMLRPAATSVNSSRGNEAYGESDGYYNPNSVSNGAYDLRGDVARIVLYVYVRWGCTNTGSEYNPDGIFGADGVFESLEILLDWMEADPVDTWELGRNDSVQSITGTRNIFVDYPELAFELFEQEVPAMQTPSGIAASSAFSVTAQSSDTAHGTVSLSDNVITAAPAEGYYASGYEVLSGTAAVTQNDNAFTVVASSDCTVQIVFAEKSKYTVSFSGASNVESQTVYAGDPISLPTAAAPEGYTFLGWTESALSGETTEQPDYLTGNYTPAASATLYALYSYQAGGGVAGSGDYVKVTSAPDDWSGEYLIVYEDGNVIFNGALTDMDVTNNTVAVAITDYTISSSEETDKCKFTIAAMDGGYSIRSASGKYIGRSTDANELDMSDTALLNTISLDGSNNANANIVGAGGAYLRYNSASNQNRFRYYKSSSYTGQKAICLYKKESVSSGVLTYTGNPTDCEHSNVAAIGEAVAATCTSTGLTAGEKCADCGWIITPQQVIDKVEHSYTAEVTPPTCTVDGYTTYTCSVCGDSYTDTPVSATGHNYVDEVCSVCGAASADDLSGDYYIAAIRSSGNYWYMTNSLGTATTKRYQAEDSGLTVLPEEITTATQANIFTLQLQSDGTYKIIAKYAEGDNYLGWNSGNSGILVAETDARSFAVAAQESGSYHIYFTASEETRYLSLNNSSGSDYFAFYAGTQVNNLTLIPVAESEGCSHTNKEAVGEAVAATCTTAGITAGEKCADCGTILTAQAEIPATGHSYSDGACSVCGASQTQVVIPAIPESGNYKLVTDISELKAGGKFVIVANYSGHNYAMSVTTSGRPAAVEITVSNDTVAYVEGTTPVWTIGQYGDDIVLVNGEEYLGYSSSTTFATKTEPYAWVVTAAENNAYLLTASTATDRVVSYQADGGQFGAYSSSNTAGYCAELNFYKLTEGEVEVITSNISFKENGSQTVSATYTVGESIRIPGASASAPEGYTFVGWAEEQVLDETVVMPENIQREGSAYTVGSDEVFYALYSRAETTTGDAVYQLVEDGSSLAAGDKIVIAAKDTAVAMSTTQNSNNRGQADVTVNGTTINFDTDVQILTLENGAVDGTFGFYTGSGYLYAASSSSNNLKTKTTLDKEGSWQITVSDGTVSVVAQGANTRNTMQYNKSSSLFSCYKSDNSMQAIVLYKETIGTTETTYYTTCVHDVVTDEAVEPTNDTDGKTEGSHCANCGKVLVEQETVPCLVGKINGWNITLESDLKVNFYLFVNETVRENAQLDVTFYGKTESMQVADCEYNEEYGYLVQVDAAAAQMMDEIKLTVTDAEGNQATQIRTIRDYADYILEHDYDDAVKEMVRQMLNYGAAAQEQFNYNNSDDTSLANHDITNISQTDVPDSADQVISISGNTEGIAFYGASLVLRNKIALKFYFDTDNVTGYTFKAGETEYTPKKAGSLYYIEIQDITPDKLDTQYQVTVTDSQGNTALTVNYGPMNYMVRMKQNGDETLKTLVTALYNYHLAAKALVLSQA